MGSTGHGAFSARLPRARFCARAFPARAFFSARAFPARAREFDFPPRRARFLKDRPARVPFPGPNSPRPGPNSGRTLELGPVFSGSQGAAQNCVHHSGTGHYPGSALLRNGGRNSKRARALRTRVFARAFCAPPCNRVESVGGGGADAPFLAKAVPVDSRNSAARHISLYFRGATLELRGDRGNVACCSGNIAD